MIGLCLLDSSLITLLTITELVNKIKEAEKKVSTAKTYANPSILLEIFLTGYLSLIKNSMYSELSRKKIKGKTNSQASPAVNNECGDEIK